jgi:hypothetical protein
VAALRAAEQQIAREKKARGYSYANCEALLLSAAAMIERMDAALEPFDVEYQRQADYWPEKVRVVAWAPFREAYRITIDDLRRARAARSSTDGER